MNAALRFPYALLLTLFAFAARDTCAQKAEVFLKEGLKKHSEKNYKAAIDAYGKAIKTDKNLRDAYFNRGLCALALKDYAGSKKDFDRCLELDPLFAKAYYSRATVWANEASYDDALSDLDRTIALDSGISSAFTLRGQIRAQTGNKTGACNDFLRAHQLGDPKGEQYFNRFCADEQQAAEFFILQWPDKESWEGVNERDVDGQHSIHFVHERESIDEWTEMANMTAIKRLNITPEKAMNSLFEDVKQYAPKAKLTIIDKDDNAFFPWILFSIEAPRIRGERQPESQLWFVLRGKQRLYTNFFAIKQPALSEPIKRKWSNFFKSGKISYQ